MTPKLPMSPKTLALSGGLMALMCLAPVSCAKKGASPSATPDAPVEQNQSEAEVPQTTVATTTVAIGQTKRYSPATLACTAPDVLAAPPSASAAVVIDGSPKDWDLTTKLLTDPVGDSTATGDVKTLRMQLSDDFLWLLVEHTPSPKADELRLVFGELQIGADKILQNRARHTVSLATGASGTTVKHTGPDGVTTELGGSEVSRQGEYLEAKIPIGKIKYTLAASGWWLQVGYFSLEEQNGAGAPLALDTMARRYFPSVLGSNAPGWFFEGCRLAEDGQAPRIWLVRNFANRDGHYLNKLKVVRHAVAVHAATATSLKTKRLDDITFLALRGVAGQNHDSPAAMPNHSVMALKPEPLATAAQQRQQFEAITATLDDFYLREAHPQFVRWPLAPLFKKVITTAGQCQVLGARHYLGQFPSVSHQPAQPYQEFAQVFLAAFPTDSLYRFVEGVTAREDLLAIGADGLKVRLDATEQAGMLCQKLPRLSQASLDDIWAGWMAKDEAHVQRFHPAMLLDKDGDSLPELWETHLRLDSQNFDTDRDGFSDVTELVQATSPQDDLSYPGQLLLDREFSDWHKLIGSLITTDRDPSTNQCARGLDLLFSGAIYDHPNLHVGFQFSPIGGDFPYYFELRFQLPALGKQYMAVVRHDQRGFTLKDAATGETVFADGFSSICSMRACELSVPLAKMGIADETMTPERPITVQVKGYKLGSQPRLCDQTDLFAPLQRK